MRILKQKIKKFSSNKYKKFPTKTDTFQERLYFDADLKYISSGFDERIINIKDNTLLEGLFQSEKYFFNDLLKLKRYIILSNESIKNNPVNSDICIMNIRGGEYKRHKNFILRKDYWEKALKNFLNF